jgi:hypothetical protein
MRGWQMDGRVSGSKRAADGSARRARVGRRLARVGLASILGAAAAGCGADGSFDEGRGGGASEAVAEAAGALTSLPPPVAHWKLDEDASSTLAADASGNGATGARIGGVGATIDGRIGGAAVLDGQDDRIEVADRPAFHFTNRMTISAWVKPTDTTEGRTFVQKCDFNSPVSCAFFLGITEGQYVFFVRYSHYGIAMAYAPITPGAWEHVAGVFEDGTLRIYVNGVLHDTNSNLQGSLISSPEPILMGTGSEAPYWGHYEGGLDDVRLYDAALSGSQIKHLATAIKKKVALVRYDPYVEPGTRLSEVLGWPDESGRSQHLADRLAEVSAGGVNHQIVEDVIIDAFPLKMDGFRYDWKSYQGCRADHDSCHDPDAASYAAMMQDYEAVTGNSLCSEISSGAVDEVWLWGGDYFGFDEFALRIPKDQPAYQPDPYNPWIYDLRTKDLPQCGKTYFVMGYNPDVGFDNMMHSYGHRIESAMTLSQPGRGRWERCDKHSPWTRFICIDMDAPGKGGCGDVHYPVNATADYEYWSWSSVKSSCDTWDAYPYGISGSSLVDCSSWGCSQEGYLTYWMSHIPKNPGHDGAQWYDWWRYIVDYDDAVQPPP